MEMQQVNIFDEPIEECCSNPITGFFRDGFCHTDQMDRGLHIVCSLMTEEFLDFSKSRGNDLSTPRPEFDFPGLKAGDSWCVCAERWKEAYEHGHAPKIYLKKTNKKTTSIIPFVAIIDGRQQIQVKEFFKLSQLGILIAIAVIWFSHKYINIAVTTFNASFLSKIFN